MNTATRLKRASGTASRFALISPLAIVAIALVALTGCAQFEDSFGELQRPQSPSRTAASFDSQDSTLASANYGSSRETRDTPSVDRERSFTVGGIRVELADGQVIR